jgi:hypothetical protein
MCSSAVPSTTALLDAVQAETVPNSLEEVSAIMDVNDLHLQTSMSHSDTTMHSHIHDDGHDLHSPALEVGRLEVAGLLKVILNAPQAVTEGLIACMIFVDNARCVCFIHLHTCIHQYAQRYVCIRACINTSSNDSFAFMAGIFGAG